LVAATPQNTDASAHRDEYMQVGVIRQDNLRITERRPVCGPGDE